jgi:ATP-binding cassette subfamily B protein
VRPTGTAGQDFMSDTKSHNSPHFWRRLFRECRPYRRSIISTFVVSMLAAPMALLLPLPLKIAVDSVIGDRPMPQMIAWLLPAHLQSSHTAVLALAVGLVLVISLIDQLRGLLGTMLASYSGEQLLLGFRARLFGHVQRLSFMYHDTKGTSDSLYRIQNDTYSFQWILLHALTPLIGAAFTLIGMVVVMWKLDWRLALVALAVCPALMMITAASRNRLRTGWENAKQLESGALSVVHETLAGLRVVKAFVQEKREHGRFMERSRAGKHARLRLAMVQGSSKAMFAMTTAIGTALVLYIGVHRVQAGQLTVGNLVLVMGYLAQLYIPAQLIGETITDMQGGLASAARVLDVLDEAPDVVEKHNALPLVRAAGAIAIRNVSFKYAPDGPPVLRDVSLDIPAGTRLGIKGATGAGKTTLVNLLCRFFDPTDGQMLLDGVDLRDYRLADFRGQFAIVLQDPVLFSTTIAENIAYARPDADEDAVINAAKAARIHEFIASLPRGYATAVGERGMTLSGGQRQRISLARAFLKNAPILILDEPTSSVDLKTEAAIIEAMEQLMHGRTSIMIAHRLSTLHQCDKVIEIEDGRVIPSSSPVAAAPVS